jgi:hypothetical protein
MKGPDKRNLGLQLFPSFPVSFDDQHLGPVTGTATVQQQMGVS